MSGSQESSRDNRRGFLTREGIRNANVIQPFDDKQLDQWSYNLSLGDEVYISSQETITYLEDKKEAQIKPGEIALLLTLEEIAMPRTMAAFITLRFSKKRKGLLNISGFHVDPDYQGKLVFSVYNAGPKTVHLRREDPIFSIFLYKLGDDAGKRPERAKHQNIQHLKAEWIDDLSGPPVSLVGIDQRVNDLSKEIRHQIESLEGRLQAARNWLFAIGTGVTVGLLLALAEKFLG